MIPDNNVNLDEMHAVLNEFAVNKSSSTAACISLLPQLIANVRRFRDACCQSPPPGTASDSAAIADLSRCLKQLRRVCSFSRDVQLAVVRCPDFGATLQPLLTLQTDAYQLPAEFAWQIVVNSFADNPPCAPLIWATFETSLLQVLAQPQYPYHELARMVVYMLLITGTLDTASTQLATIFRQIVAHYRAEIAAKTATLPVHLQLCLEYFCAGRQKVALFARLEAADRVAFLQFIADHLRRPPTADGDNEAPQALVSRELVQHLSKEFKKKSDCVLKTETSYVNSINPREVYALLDVLSTMSGSPEYGHLLAADHSLFLNCGVLLVAIGSLGSQSANIFTPVSKLGQIAPNSVESAAIEADVSYDMKSMLVRCIANLAHRNARNQELAREMDILRAVLNCTQADARNPLIKEWSVLAIRNLCDGCAENQALVRGLTKVGDADNSEVLKEFNLEMGQLRIGK